jgi:hypothetical protein
MRNRLARALGREMNAASTSNGKVERAGQTGRADKSELLSSSTYCHPLHPLPNCIDHVTIINSGCNPHYMEV